MSAEGNSRLNPIPNYPSSIDVYLRWTQGNRNIQLRAASGLLTAAMTGGNNKVYNHRWKLPNCHFFKRYMPSEWSFSLVFDPQYPAIEIADAAMYAASNISKPAHTPLVALEPKQSKITIPISFYFNATAMADSHHKGC
jgi:hypothetical protein